MKFVDLSHPLNEKTPVFPGDPKVKIQPQGILERDGYEDHLICIGTHIGTHIDAPSHMILGEKNLDQFPLEKFTGKGFYIKVDDDKFDSEQIKNVKISEGDIVIFHTGMSENYQELAYFEDYPQLPEDIANYLVEKKVKMVGVDMCSLDHKPYPIHKIFLSNNILLIENLINLSQLEGKEFKIYAFPLNLQVDGSPTRVIAEIA